LWALATRQHFVATAIHLATTAAVPPARRNRQTGLATRSFARMMPTGRCDASDLERRRMPYDVRNTGALIGRHGFSIRHLEVFWAVMRTGSQAGAASLLNISQPAVSKMVKYIEQQAGIVLFYPTHGRLVPTSEAEVLFVSVEEIFDRMAATERVVDDLQHRARGESSIAFSPGLGSRLISAFLVAFRTVNRSSRLRVKLLPPPAIAERLLRKEVDLGVFHGPLGDSSVRSTVLRDDNVVCVLPADHPLAAEAVLTPAKLAQEALLSGSVTGPYAWMHALRDTFAAEGIPYRLAIECHHAQHVYDMVAAGLGVGLVPPVHLAGDDPRVVVRSFAPRVQSPLLAMLPANKSPAQATTVLIKSIRTVLRTLPPSSA
jgi:DNA-binding transcriptional LysR family regulator